MTTIFVTYAGDAGTPFDRTYYVESHLPLVREAWTGHGLTSIGAFFPTGDNAGVIAIAVCKFRDEAAVAAALESPQTPAVMADVKRFTAVAPTLSRAAGM